MATLTDIQFFASPVWVVFKRIEYHKQAGRMLEGLKWTREGIVRVESTSTLPSLQPYFVDFSSKQYQAGAKRGDPKKADVPMQNTLTLQLELATDLKHGFVQSDPTALTSRKGHLEWAAIVQDAIETDETGEADAMLEGTLIEPVSFLMREPESGAVSLSSVLEVTLVGRPHYRGERRLTFPELP